MGSLILLAALFANTGLLSNTAMAQENGYEDGSYNNNYSSDLYTVWEDSSLGNTDIFFKSSHTLHDPVNLSNTTGTSLVSGVSSSGDNVYVIWIDNISGNNEILFRASNDSGQTFGSTINLSNTNGTSSDSVVFSHGNNVYVVWADSTFNSEILFRASNDSGQTFGSTINLSNNTGNSFGPDIFSHGNNVYVVWTDTISGISNDIYFTSSKDNGQTFSKSVNLSNNTGSSTIPQLSSSGTNVYVTWMDNSLHNTEIFFTFSIDNGKTFNKLINLSNNTGISAIPEISSSGDNVYVVWEDKTPGIYDIFLASSNDNGKTFGSTINLSNNTGYSEHPQITSSGDNVYVVWSDNTPGNNDILMRGNGGGVTFGSTINISNNIGSSEFPHISSIGKDIYVVWQDFTAGAGEIFSITNNQIISSPINLSDNSGNSQSPQISSS
jgi:hypothetical protein